MSTRRKHVIWMYRNSLGELFCSCSVLSLSLRLFHMSFECWRGDIFVNFVQNIWWTSKYKDVSATASKRHIQQPISYRVISQSRRPVQAENGSYNLQRSSSHRSLHWDIWNFVEILPWSGCHYEQSLGPVAIMSRAWTRDEFPWNFGYLNAGSGDQGGIFTKFRISQCRLRWLLVMPTPSHNSSRKDSCLSVWRLGYHRFIPNERLGWLTNHDAYKRHPGDVTANLPSPITPQSNLFLPICRPSPKWTASINSFSSSHMRKQRPKASTLDYRRLQQCTY